MTTYEVGKLLGGIANGKDVPVDWSSIAEWEESGTGAKGIYEVRHFYHGADRFDVWVAVGIPEPDFQAIMWWHREMYRGDLVAAQKELLHESVQAASSYTNVIMVAGFAALFTLWVQMTGPETGKFAPLTSYVAGILLFVSVLSFIGWEVFGMIVRSMVNFELAKAVNDAPRFEAHIRRHREKMATLSRRLLPAWIVVLAIALLFGLASFRVMMSALIHGAWVNLQ